jgi:hypothetical protein
VPAFTSSTWPQPAYAQLAPSTINMAAAPVVTAAGSKIALRIGFNKALAGGNAVALEPVAADMKLPAVQWTAEGGAAMVGAWTAKESLRFRIPATDTDGFRNTALEEYELIVRPDPNPTVQIESPRRTTWPDGWRDVTSGSIDEAIDRQGFTGHERARAGPVGERIDDGADVARRAQLAGDGPERVARLHHVDRRGGGRWRHRGRRCDGIGRGPGSGSTGVLGGQQRAEPGEGEVADGRDGERSHEDAEATALVDGRVQPTCGALATAALSLVPPWSVESEPSFNWVRAFVCAAPRRAVPLPVAVAGPSTGD